MENLDETGNGPENDDSDSGDSLFITQKPIPHPVRAKGLPQLSQRSTPLTPRFLESSSDSEPELEPKDAPKKGRTRSFLPSFKFPFLKRRKPQLPEDGSMCFAQNRAIHHSGIVGFFKCLEERQSLEPTLPILEFKDDQITPITDDEKTDEEDVKIIDKGLFVYSLKPIVAKSAQPWFRSSKKKIRPTPGKKSKSQLASEHQRNLDSSDSDATMIDDYELPTPSSKKELDTNQVNELPLEDSDNTESQSILQMNITDFRRRGQGNSLDQNGLNQSTKKKCKTAMTGGSNGNLDAFNPRQQSHLPDKTKCTDSESLTKNGRRILTKNNGNAGLSMNMTFSVETSQGTDHLSVRPDTERRANEQSIQEITEQSTGSNVEDLNKDTDTVQRKKKKKKHKNNQIDLENTETAADCIDLDPMQIPQKSDSIPTATENERSDKRERKRKKHEKTQKPDPGDCNDEQIVPLEKLQLVNTDKHFLSKSAERPRKSELVANDGIATQSDTSVSAKKKKRTVSSPSETLESTNGPLAQSRRAAERGISAGDIGSTEISCHKSETLRKTKKKKKSKEKVWDGDCDLETTPVAGPLFKRDKEENGSNFNKDAKQPDLNNEGLDNDVTVQKKKNKKKHKNKTDLEITETQTQSLNLDPLQLLINDPSDNITSVDKMAFDNVDSKHKKRKKKQKASSDDFTDEQDAAVQSQQKRTGKNVRLELDESQERSAVVDFANSFSDCLVTQKDESEPVRKKKKRKVSSAAEMAENADLPFSKSAQSHGADTLGISTNVDESAETHGFLQESEIRSKMKKKKRKGDKLDVNDNISEAREKSTSNENKDNEHAEVALSHNCEGRQRKKKKKKNSKDELHPPDTEKTAQTLTSEVVEETGVTKKKKKKKKYKDGDEGEVIEAAKETELEQTTVKGEKKKKKNRIKDVERIVSKASHGDTSTSPERQETSKRSKLKKKLYMPSSEPFQGEVQL